MSPQDLHSRLATLKAELQKQPAGSDHRDDLEQTIADIERQLALPEPLNPAVWLSRLRDWEARLAVEHPILSQTLADVAHKLEAMGI